MNKVLAPGPSLQCRGKGTGSVVGLSFAQGGGFFLGGGCPYDHSLPRRFLGWLLAGENLQEKFPARIETHAQEFPQRYRLGSQPDSSRGVFSVGVLALGRDRAIP